MNNTTHHTAAHNTHATDAATLVLTGAAALPDATEYAILIDDATDASDAAPPASWSLSASVLAAIGIGDDGDEAMAHLYPHGVVVGRHSRA